MFITCSQSLALKLLIPSRAGCRTSKDGFLQGRQVGLQYMTETGRLS